MKKNKYIIKPNIKNYSLMQKIKGFDYEGKSISTNVINEKISSNVIANLL